jgi:dTDP-4-dehydrorhamnose reductase
MVSAVVGEMAACGFIDKIPEIEKQQLSAIAAFRAKRSRFTAMQTRHLSETLGRAPRHWREALATHVRYRIDGNSPRAAPGRVAES